MPKNVPSFLNASVRVLDLSLGEMLWSRRTVFMTILVAAPVVIAVALRSLVGLHWITLEAAVNGQALPLTGPGIFGLTVWVFYLRFTVPVLGVFYGTSLIRRFDLSVLLGDPRDGHWLEYHDLASQVPEDLETGGVAALAVAHRCDATAQRSRHPGRPADFVMIDGLP